MAKAQREKQKMKNVVLRTRRDVASELIRSLPGGCKFASDLLGMKQKKDRKSTRLNSSHLKLSRMPSSA